MIRRHGSRPTLALWMLVAIADVALLAAAAGTTMVLVTVAGAALLGTATAATMLVQRRPANEAQPLRRRA
ncbi:hypothetical protein [Actinoplanes sp. N902-109]|uniref:hypothetical protein n=1 Tax=Actinoplanes sp. (strain N902-109) TaxID=649831 RepID=UPI00032966F1|nr:hypothetical protein [Actinoplanes sp. N902-109]AGL20993.1 hypothetical protein L083_7483 [Actinoplanes sp. N902-109]